MGRNYGAELKETGYLDDVDLIVPVPLHPRKERKRGYNQSTAIAEGIGAILNKPVEDKILFRKHFSETQTRKGRFERWQNVSDLFDLKIPGYFCDKHVLVVDDVIDTASTI